jgi:hypothetical protein
MDFPGPGSYAQKTIATQNGHAHAHSPLLRRPFLAAVLARACGVFLDLPRTGRTHVPGTPPAARPDPPGHPEAGEAVTSFRTKLQAKKQEIEDTVGLVKRKREELTLWAWTVDAPWDLRDVIEGVDSLRREIEALLAAPSDQEAEIVGEINYLNRVEARIMESLDKGLSPETDVQLRLVLGDLITCASAWTACARRWSRAWAARDLLVGERWSVPCTGTQYAGNPLSGTKPLVGDWPTPRPWPPLGSCAPPSP